MRVEYMTMRRPLDGLSKSSWYAAAYRLFMPGAGDSDWAYLHDRDSTPLEQAGLSAVEAMRPPLLPTRRKDSTHVAQNCAALPRPESVSTRSAEKPDPGSTGRSAPRSGWRISSGAIRRRWARPQSSCLAPPWPRAAVVQQRFYPVPVLSGL